MLSDYQIVDTFDTFSTVFNVTCQSEREFIFLTDVVIQEILLSHKDLLLA